MVVTNSDSRIPGDIFLWHTFGDHGEETESEIIDRKKREIAISESGNTFWTIGMQKKGNMFANWKDQLDRQSDRGSAYVVCGGKASKASMKPGIEATRYTSNLQTLDNWQPVPKGISATRDRLGKQMSLAFVVKDIQTIGENSKLMVEWWDHHNRKQNWATDCPGVHSMDGVKLLRKSKEGKPIIKDADCRHILKLEYPYFVMLNR